MLSTLYIAGDSSIHRLAPRTKIISMIAFGTAIFLVHDLYIILAATICIFSLYKLAGIKLRCMIKQLKPAIWILLALFAVQYYLNDLQFAAVIVLRFAGLILAASLITLTTKTSDMVDGINLLLWRFERWLPVEHISLAISLCIRFIPTIQGITSDVKEAQQARGLSGNIFAIAVPVIVRTLKMADEISEAIYARSFDTKPPTKIYY